jgi:hypothetical protein
MARNLFGPSLCYFRADLNFSYVVIIFSNVIDLFAGKVKEISEEYEGSTKTIILIY